MNISDICMYNDFFMGRSKSRFVPLGWDWFVMRIENIFMVKEKTANLLQKAEKVLALEEEIALLPHDELYTKLEEHRILFRLSKESEEEKLYAMALVREVAHRVRQEKPYLCQVAGALGILENTITEMATGEGKTLTAALATVLAAWRGKGCHVITSNDYLATRDAQTMSEFYAACSLSCAAISQESSPPERKSAYAADITYLTSKDVVADFLRDNMVLGSIQSHEDMLIHCLANKPEPQILQRGLFYAIVDEADSVLCDGGSTPLIISVPKQNAPTVEQYQEASKVAQTMRAGKDFLINTRFREVSLTDMGKMKVLESIKAPHQWAKKLRAIELTLQAIEAREFFHIAVHYVVHENKVIIVDESTGRIMPDHEWRDGLHQAVSAKEGVEVIPPRSTTAQSTFQDFFLRYKNLGGMTGTAWEARKEFLQFYGLPVVKIPTNRPCLRFSSYKAFHLSHEEKVKDILSNIVSEHAKGRAVLVGTKSIEASEEISAGLKERGVVHEVLNALLFEREADIIALAGRKNAVTVATNMAGRGTDIKLNNEVRDQGGLHVIVTELYHSSRVDRQLLGRCARQGDPGTTAEIISISDDIFKNMPSYLKAFIKTLIACSATNGALNTFSWKIATAFQKKEDSKAFKMRKQMVKTNRKFAQLLSYSGKQN